ncbi:galactose-specific lectin nattectin-like [Poeciliopsis prolifica]|uniref:galactose-specific lectin nattectin-like n=1 Tax=Poeciliopsis prolifica TaxID=188132 RepID=UPI002413CE6B|nr:galactose-specific lectin nattectin-like [Poeciliopsis prolifica]
MAAGLLFSLLLGLTFGLWDGADACQLKAITEVDCPPGWTWFERRCYIFVKVKKSWAEAENDCLSMNGNLASFHSSNDYYFLKHLVYRTTGKDTRSWIGGHSALIEGIWFWSDGSKFVFNSWTRNNTSDGKRCMDINIAGQTLLSGADCYTTLPYICARDP